MSAENDAPAERTQRQVYFRLSHEEDQEMWRAFREGRATEALNLIITTHVAREHHAGLAEVRAALADPDEQYGAGTLHDNAPRDYTDEEAHIWTVGYRAALEYVATRVLPSASGDPERGQQP